MESFTGFVVSDVTLRKPKEKIIDQIAKELNSQLAIFEFQITQNRRTFAITFDKPQKLEQIQQLFPTNDCKSIPKYEQRVTKYQPIYITNFPLEFKEKEKFTKLIEIFGDAQSIIFSKGFSIVQMKKDYYSTCLARFLPEIQFETGKFDVYLNSDDIPLVHISPIPIKFTQEEVIELIEQLYPVVMSEVQPNVTPESYSMNVLLESNDNAYDLIDQLNFMKIEETEVLFTHFKKREDIEEMKKWELRVTGLKPSVTCHDLNMFFSQFGRVFSVKLNYRPFFAIITFESQEDAQSAVDKFAIKDGDLNVSYMRDKSYQTIFVQHFPFYYKDQDIKKIFPTATSIRIQPNKIRGMPPTVILNFASEQIGEEALKKGNQTFVRDLRLFCVPYISKDRQYLETVGIKAKPDSTIFVRNLKYTCTFENVVKLCSAFGQMERVTLLVKKGRQDSAAIVQFTNPKAAETAIERIEEFEIDGFVPHAEKYVDPKVKRAMELQQTMKNIRSTALAKSLKQADKEEEEQVEQGDDEEEEQFEPGYEEEEQTDQGN